MGKKRKTREQKIRAKLRRLEKKLRVEAQVEPGVGKNNTLRAKAAEEQPVILADKTDAASLSYVLSDLKKTAILALLAISVEIVVYWWLKLK